MPDIWILGTTLREDGSGQLVRADAISHLLATADELTASRLGSDDTVTLVHKGAVGLGAPAPRLPEDFHLALLAKLGEARTRAVESKEDLVILPDLDDDQAWNWSVFPLSELWPG